MTYFKLPNTVITDKNLTDREFAVLTYLISLHSNIKSEHGYVYKRVKQSTIARNCGIKAVQTVSKVIARLMQKGFISHILGAYREDNFKGTYTYVLNTGMFEDKYYTKVKRRVFRIGLSPLQLRVFCFISKCVDKRLGYCWQSYNDMAQALRIKRCDAISAVSALIGKRLIQKERVMRYDNDRVFSDNHYSLTVVRRIKRRYKKKKDAPPTTAKHLNPCLFSYVFSDFYCSITKHKSQAFFVKKLKNFFVVTRGSPQKLKSYI